MKNTHNAKLEKIAAKRRAKILREYEVGLTQKELAEKYGRISRQRIQWMIAKAKMER